MTRSSGGSRKSNQKGNTGGSELNNGGNNGQSDEISNIEKLKTLVNNRQELLTTELKDKMLAELEKASKYNKQPDLTEFRPLAQALGVYSANLMEQLIFVREEMRKVVMKADEIKKKYINGHPRFIEKEGTQKLFVHKNKARGASSFNAIYADWSDYLYDVKDFVAIVVGGVDSDGNGISQLELSVQNLQNEFDKSLEGVAKVATGLNVQSVAKTLELLRKIQDENTAPVLCSLKEDVPTDSKVSITVITVQENTIKPPSKVVLRHDKLAEPVEYRIHERVNFQFKIGISGSSLKRTDFEREMSNGLPVLKVIEDSVKNSEIRSNAMAILEWYPGGRDVGRFSSIFDNGQKVPFGQRIGLAAGLRISDDPFQTLFGGVSIGLSKGFSATFGVALEATPKLDQLLFDDPNSTVDEILSNADREYKAQLFVGVSISPALFIKALGLTN